MLEHVGDPPLAVRPPGALWGVPAVFKRARWVGQTTACPAERVLGLTLRCEDGSLVRVAVDVQELRDIVARVRFYGAIGRQSPSSSDSPTVPQLPHEGHQQVPAAISSAACSGEA